MWDQCPLTRKNKVGQVNAYFNCLTCILSAAGLGEAKGYRECDATSYAWKRTINCIACFGLLIAGRRGGKHYSSRSLKIDRLNS